MELLTAALGPMFTWFGSISNNNAIKNQTELEQKKTDQLLTQGWFSSVLATNQSKASQTNTTMLVVAAIFIAIIVAVIVIKKKK